MNTDTPAPARVWLITGASSGLGRAVAQAALDAGEAVVATARKAGALDDLVERHPRRVAAVELDVTDTARVRTAVDAASDAFGRVDVLVNSAGRALIGAAEETTDAELRDLMDVHFFGPAALTRAVLPGMRAQGSGAVVQISSMGGRLSFAAVSAYSATKFALEGYSEALAEEVASFGIRVLIVEPGAFRTGLHGTSMRMTTSLPAYDAVVGPIRAMQAGFDGTQPGDPAKAAAAIRAALDADDPPLRLPLGNDAADAVRDNLDRLRAEFDVWEPLSRSTDLDPP